MRKIILSFLLVVPPIANAEVDRSIGMAYERYSVIAGAWFVNQKCKFLSDEQAAEFTRDVKAINVSLSLALENPAMQLSIQKSAKAVADSEKYSSCPTVANEIVTYGLTASRAWSTMIRQATIAGAIRLSSPLPSDTTK